MAEAKENERVDTPGRIRGAIAGPVSRRGFIALSGGSAAAFLAACGSDGSDESTTAASAPRESRETAQFGKGDIGILNYALTLEYIEAAFYAALVESRLLKGSDLEVVRRFGDQEEEHVAALAGAVRQLGGKPAPRPKTEFPLESARSALKLAARIENVGVAAYLGQVPNIQSPEVLASALAIHSVEGRHASTLNRMMGDTIGPYGTYAIYGKPADAKTVLKSVEPFIVG